jgi:hypothetical protein
MIVCVGAITSSLIAPPLSDTIAARPKDEGAGSLALGTRRLEWRAAMSIVIVGLAFMFAIWIAVIWGSNLFNKNMQ